MPKGARILRFLTFAVWLCSVLQISYGATQSFSLAAQWNLITFQVVPTNPDPEALFSTLPGFQSAWSYDASLGMWQRYIKPAGTATQQTNDIAANALIALPSIQPGRAYWVFTTQAVASWQVNGTVPSGQAFPSLDLKAGWNMIGIPVGATSITNSEPVSLLAVLTAAGFDYDALLTWESQTFKTMFRPEPVGTNEPPNPLEGLPPDAPFPNFDLAKDLGRGYWVRVLDPAIIRPRLVTTVRPDIDSEPLNNFPAKEDLNISGGVQPKNIQEQDAIRFFPGEDIQTLGIANLGDSNGSGGILIWEAIWTPVTDTGTPEPWIRLFSSPGLRETRDVNGKLLFSHTNLTGVTTLENDTVYLRLDRRNLGRGTHQGTLQLRTSVGEKSYAVIAEVGGLEGDFAGYAVIQSVNGKRNPVPDVDLHISFYEDNRVTGLLRGLIDSSQALLWPSDVPLIGYRVADDGNRFTLSGSFVLPPGDQNAEPFDFWSESDASAGADIDWLNDGVLDARNPFPFPVQRTVSLQGALVIANATDGYVLEGDYQEIIYGMSREPIRLNGTFHLERKAARPLSSRLSTTADSGVEPVVEKRNNIPVTIPSGGARESAVTLQTELDLRSLQVALTFAAPLAHSSLLIKLIAPTPTPVELVLYDGRTPAGAINPKLLELVNIPLDRPPHGDLLTFLLNVTKTKTDPALSRFWKIVIQNTGSQSVTLANWSLRLEGQPVADVFGVVKTSDTPISGVTVAVDGAPFSSYSGLTDSEGRFFISRVPLLPLNFSGSKAGYLPADLDSPGLSTVFTSPFLAHANLTFSTLESNLIRKFNPLAGAPVALAGVPGFAAGTTNAPFELQLEPEESGQARITAGPLIAFVGSTVEFDVINPASSAFWDFGDSTGLEAIASSHVYQTAGFYRVNLYSPANSASPQDSIEVIVLPSPGHAPARPADLRGEPLGLDIRTSSAVYPAYVFQPFITSGGVLPAHKVGTYPDGADRYVSDITPQSTFAAGETNVFGAAFVGAMPIQMAYAASLDMDLAPYTTPVGTTKTFVSDSFLPFEPSDSPINVNNQGFKHEDFNYSLVASLWENTRAADGSLEYTQDAQNGLIVWGNPTTDPNQNYSTQAAEARDGASYTVALDDDSFHPHIGVTLLSDLATHQVATHFRMSSSVGATILTAPVMPASIKPAKLKRSIPENTLEPELQAGGGPTSRNLYYQLHTGFLGTRRIFP